MVGGDGVNIADFAAFAGNWNQVRLLPVLNEIHYDPYVKIDLLEYIELHNPGTTDFDLSGWYFSDGISYRFPPGSILPASGYIVVAMNPANVQSIFGLQE